MLKQRFCKDEEVQRKFMDNASSSEKLLKSQSTYRCIYVGLVCPATTFICFYDACDLYAH